MTDRSADAYEGRLDSDLTRSNLRSLGIVHDPHIYYGISWLP